MHDKWGINLYLEKVQVKIEVKIKPDIFIGSVSRFKTVNLLLHTARFIGHNLSPNLTFLSGFI